MGTILRAADQRPVPKVAKQHRLSAQTIDVWRKHFVQRLRGKMVPGLLAWRLGRAGRVPVFGRVGPPRRHVCHDRWPARNHGLGRDPRRTGGRCPATAIPPSGRSGELVPGGSPGARPYAVVRCTRRGGGAGRVGPPATRRRLRLLRQIDDELVASVEQYLRVSSRS